MADGGDVTVKKFQPVAAVRRMGLVCKSIFVECAVQPVRALIAGKNSSRAVPSMGSWSEADNQEPGILIAKTWDRLPPILLVCKPFRFLPRNLFAPYHQTGAFPAGDHFGI